MINPELLDLELDVSSRELLNARLNRIPFSRELGVTFTGMKDDIFRSEIEYQHSLTDASGNLSKAALAAALDQIGSFAVWSRTHAEQPHATIALSIGYIRPVAGDVTCFAQLLGIESGVAQIQLTAFAKDSRAPVAHGILEYFLGSYPGRVLQVPGTASQEPLNSDYRKGRFLRLMSYNWKTDHGVVTPEPQIIGSTDTQAIHGGVIAAGMIETAEHARENPGSWMSHFSMEFLRSGQFSTLQFVPRTLHKGRTTEVLQIDAIQENGARLVAHSTARFVSGQAA